MLANSVLLTSETGTIDIVGLDINADDSRELPNTNEGLSAELDALGVPYTITVVDPAGLDAALATADVVVAYEQEGGTLSGAELTAVQDSLDAFTASGGVAIALGFANDDSLILDTERNLRNDGYTLEFGAEWDPVDGEQLVQGVPVETQPFSNGQGTITVDPAVTDAQIAATSASSGGAVAVYRRASLCGNGVLDAGEVCDDGNFDAGDGCSPICTGDGEYSCRNNSILVTIDNPSTTPEINAYLDGRGIVYDYIPQTAGEVMADLALLNTYDTVIYYKRERTSTTEELDAMEAYIQNGGFLITTGRDSIGSPTDSGFAGLIRSATDGDGPFTADASVTDDTVPATNGPFGTFPVGTEIPITLTDHDQASPLDAGTISVASIGDRSKLLYTPEVGDGGVVYYWNGNGNLGDSYFGDWTTPGVAQDMFMNMLDQSCRGRAVYVGADWWEREAGFDQMLVNSVFNYAARDETVNVAAWTFGGDASREIPNTDAVITEGAAALGRTVSIEPFGGTTVPDLEAALADANVLLFYENEGGSGTATVTSWAPTLANFVDEGGIVVFLGWREANTAYLDASGLMPGVTRVDGGGAANPVTFAIPDHPLLAGVAAATTPDATGSVAVSGEVVSVGDAYSGSVLAYRVFR